MNHSQMRAFHHVAVAGSFTGAARALGVSQPTLSAQVKAMEDGYGVRLFERQGRRIALTPLGQDLLAVTERIFALEAEAEALMSGVRDPARGNLALGADSPVHSMTFLSALKREHGGLVPSVSFGETAGLLRDLREYRCDLALLTNPPEATDLTILPFRRDRLVALVPAEVGPAGVEPVSLSLLLDAPLILLRQGSIARDVLEAAAAARRLPLVPAMELDRGEAVREAVAAGLGIGVVFESDFQRDSGLRTQRIAGADLTVHIDVVCLSERQELTNIAAAMAIAAEQADPAANPVADPEMGA